MSVSARYFLAMREKDLDALLTMFAPDATLTVPDGRSFEGRDAIAGWFAHLFAAVSPSPTCVAEVATARSIAVEIETHLPGGSLRRTANFFDLDERGLITGLRSYARG